MRNRESDRKTDCLKKLYMAHETISDIGESIGRLYASATVSSPKTDGMPKHQPNPRRFENIMVRIFELQTQADKLLEKRIAFDMFLYSLTPTDKRLLDLRCKECLPWKEIAYGLNISRDTAERQFRRICGQAEKAGVFDNIQK